MPIDGVTEQACKTMENARGFLREITRNDESGFFPIGQLYQTSTKEGVVKAWYKHRTQYDGILILGGRMKMALIDDRSESPTYGEVQEIVVSADEPKFVRIPPGLWHGFQAVGGDLWLLHFNSDPIQFDEPDEERLPMDDPRLAYRW